MLVSGERSQFAYYRAFLQLHRPDVVITMEDNNITFYATKVILSSCKSIAIQNGLRADLSVSREYSFCRDLQRLSRLGYEADVIVTQGGLGTAFYRSALPNSKSEMVEAGHLMNNAIALEGVDVFERPRRLVFISKLPYISHADSSTHWQSQVRLHLHDTPLLLGEYHRVDGAVARACAVVACNHSLPFVVLGKRSERQKSEFEFFAEHLKGLEWTYVPSDSQSTSYESLRAGDVIVNTDSTLGYELLARGLRTAFVSARFRTAGHPEVRDLEFGYPVIAQSRGSFWTDESSDSEIRRVLDFVMWAKQAEWLEQTKFVRKELFQFDPGNTIFCRVLADAGVANRGPRSWARELIPDN